MNNTTTIAAVLGPWSCTALGPVWGGEASKHALDARRAVWLVAGQQAVGVHIIVLSQVFLHELVLSGAQADLELDQYAREDQRYQATCHEERME